LTVPIFIIVTPIFGTRIRIICINYFIGMYWIHLTSFIENYSGIKFTYYGENVPLRESAIVVTNHTSFIDWLMVFPLALRKGRLGCCNFFAKDVIKWIPGFGWGIWLKGSIMLKREWSKDEINIKKTFELQIKTNIPLWLIIHPEGTRINETKIKKIT